MNVIIGLVICVIIGISILSKQIAFIILLFMAPYVLSIYNLFNKKFNIYLRVPLSILLFVLYKYKFSRLL